MLDPAQPPPALLVHPLDINCPLVAPGPLAPLIAAYGFAQPLARGPGHPTRPDLYILWTKALRFAAPAAVVLPVRIAWRAACVSCGQRQ